MLEALEVVVTHVSKAGAIQPSRRAVANVQTFALDAGGSVWWIDQECEIFPSYGRNSQASVRQRVGIVGRRMRHGSASNRYLRVILRRA
jgi:hypothetical protein